METTFTNNPLNSATSVTTDKKVWASPTVEVIDRGYVEGGAIVGLHESTTTPTFGKKGSLS